MVIGSDTDEEVVPLNANITLHSSGTKSFETENEMQIKLSRLSSSDSVDVKEIGLPVTTMGASRTNSIKREPPKILMNRVPPAGIGKY